MKPGLRKRIQFSIRCQGPFRTEGIIKSQGNGLLWGIIGETCRDMIEVPFPGTVKEDVCVFRTCPEIHTRDSKTKIAGHNEHELLVL